MKQLDVTFHSEFTFQYSDLYKNYLSDLSTFSDLYTSKIVSMGATLEVQLLRMKIPLSSIEDDNGVDHASKSISILPPVSSPLDSSNPASKALSTKSNKA